MVKPPIHRRCGLGGSGCWAWVVGFPADGYGAVELLLKNTDRLAGKGQGGLLEELNFNVG